MSQAFQPRSGLILVTVEITGPLTRTTARLALDTGATCSVLRAALLEEIGYDLANAHGRAKMTTGSGVESVPRVRLDRLSTLGQSQVGLVVLTHTLPASLDVDGLLGLDFLRDRELLLDFRRGVLSLR